MKAVLRHELSSHFTGLSGWAFGAFVLFFAGIFCMVYNLKSQIVNFEYVMGNMAFIYLIVVPLLTMRVIAEERRLKTDQLLYSLPLSAAELVLGKYFALLAVMLLPLLILCLYPPVLAHYGTVNLPLSYAAILGFFFLGAALAAIGMFLSSLTESQTVAAGLCFAVLLVNYFAPSLAVFISGSAFASLMAFTTIIILFGLISWRMTRSLLTSLTAALVMEALIVVLYTFFVSHFENLFPSLLAQLSLFDRFYILINGSLDLTVPVYDLSVSAVFVFLTIQSLEKRRWSE